MNKAALILGVAAAVTVAGCKDPDYRSRRVRPQDEVKEVAARPQPKPQEEVKVEKNVCKCPAGTKHTSPCLCGADNCACVVVAPAKKPEPKPVPAPQPEYTMYTVQRGDYLAKISKRYNVKVDAIRKLNPQIKKDVIWIGMKLKLPGKLDVPAAAPVAKKPVAAKKPAVAAYTGATKEYTVKSGDTLGAIAYGHGINIRQLKELNALKSDNLRIGQKLKVPAAPVKAAAVKAKPQKPEAPAAKAAPQPAEKPAEPEAPAAPAAPQPAPAPAPAPDAAPAVESVPVTAPAADSATATPTYVVQEGDDMTGVSIRWGVSAAAIRELNNLGENDQLVPGQILKLPADAQQ